MGDPRIILTREEQELVTALREEPRRKWRRRQRHIPFYLVFILLALGLYAYTILGRTGWAVHTRYEDCQMLTSPAVHNVEKLKIFSAYLPRRPLCRIQTGYFESLNLFQPGRSSVQLTLALQPGHLYQLDAPALLAALAPDKDRIPVAAAAPVALELAGMLNDISAGTIDMPRLVALLRQSGTLAGLMAYNAERLKYELQALPAAYGVAKEAVIVPPWLDMLITLKSLKPVRDTRPAPPPSGPRSFHPRHIMEWLRGLMAGA